MPLRVKPVNSPGTVAFNMPPSRLVAVFAAPSGPSVTVGIDCEDIGIVDFSTSSPVLYQVNEGAGSVVAGRIEVDLSDVDADVRLYFDLEDT